ncbi:MAG: hypothetical protein JNL61_15155 [Rhizobiaceae bacterium]|nr:hypothetical protein [Rhizobiaceae bacterium]
MILHRTALRSALPNKTPVAPAVREMLERVVASRTFSRSERARDLLRHLVEREQAGEAEQLKGFSIGVDVFGKDSDFDPTTDAVVRVQAGRLRELLAHYYADEGAGDVLRISIPRGGYVPVYEWHGRVPQPEEPVATPDTAVSPGGKRLAGVKLGGMTRHIALLWSAVAVLALAVAVLLADRRGGEEPLSRTEPATGSIALRHDNVLPTVSVVAARNAGPVASVAATIRVALSAFETIDLVETDAPKGGSHFVFVVTPSPDDEGVFVYVQDRTTRRVLLSRRLSKDAIDAGRLNDTVAALLANIAPASGMLYAEIERNGELHGPAQCLLLYERFYQEPVGLRHKAAYDCFDRLVRAGPQPAIVYAQMSSLQIQGVTDGYPLPADVSVETAQDLAWKAVRSDPTSAAAHRAMGYLRSLSDTPAEALPWMKKAHELNIYDPGMAAVYAYALVAAGSYPEGERIMLDAVNSASAHSTWWDYTLFLAAFMSGDRDVAYRASLALTTPGRPHYLAARLIASSQSGKAQLTEALRRQFLAEFPSLAADPRAIFRARHPSKEIVETLVAALAHAGISGEAG